MIIEQGKRYVFHTSTYGGTNSPKEDSHEVSALFTGEYDKDNRNALLIDKNGVSWSISEKDLRLYQK